MKIERRALIAFVASMLLFLAYDAFYLSPKMEKQRERRAAEQAQRVAEQVARSGRSQALEPMSPYERRVIHMALRKHSPG